MPIDKLLQGIIRGESGFTELAHAPLSFQYRVHYPLIMAVRRIAIGAGIGAGLLGLPRLLLTTFKGDAPIPLNRLDVGKIAVQALHLEFPLLNFFLAFLVLLFCIYFALRIWLIALRGSER